MNYADYRKNLLKNQTAQSDSGKEQLEARLQQGNTGNTGTAKNIDLGLYVQKTQNWDPAKTPGVQKNTGNTTSGATSGRPGEFSSAYKDRMDSLYEQIMGREPFSYDMRADALYRNYRDQAIRDGRMAMEDSMGEAAGLTGGYGSTYSQRVGNQSYNSYMQQLNDKIPELEERAYNRYTAEGDELANQYAMAYQGYSDDYSQYRDRYNDWLNDRDYEANRDDEEYSRSQDLYNRYTKLMEELGYRPSDEELERAGISPEEADKWMAVYEEAHKKSGSSTKTKDTSASSSEMAEAIWNNCIENGATPAQTAQRIEEARQKGLISDEDAAKYKRRAAAAESNKYIGEGSYMKE